ESRHRYRNPSAQSLVPAPSPVTVFSQSLRQLAVNNRCDACLGREPDVQLYASIVIVAATLTASTASPAQTRAAATAPLSLAGAWTLNRDSSDNRDNLPGPGAGRPEGGGRRGAFGRGRGGVGGGGFGGGDRGRGGDRADMQRQRDAIRDLMAPADRLTIVQA